MSRQCQIILISFFLFFLGLVSSKENIWKLKRVDLERFPNAKCLDGSPAGFWTHAGEGTGKNKFFIHHQGGGWCLNEENCYSRSLGYLGSSKDWMEMADCSKDDEAQPCYYDGNSGLQSTDPIENPMLYNWQKVFIGYCDGGSYSGHVSSPIPVTTTDANGTIINANIHFKGRYIIDAIYETLLEDFKMDHASEIIISGSSAGSLAVYLHVDYLSNKIKSASAVSPRIVGVPDAGFFMDLPSINGSYLYTPNYKSIFYFQNVSDSVNDACVNYYKETDPDNAWKCFMAQYTLPFIQTPLFIVNSFVDSWQGDHIMGITYCDPTASNISTDACPPDVSTYMNNFRSSMLKSSLGDFIANLEKNQGGAWLCTCWTHTLTDWEYSWKSIYINSTPSLIESRKTNLRNSFNNWYSGEGGTVLNIDGEWNTNPC